MVSAGHREPGFSKEQMRRPEELTRPLVVCTGHQIACVQDESRVAGGVARKAFPKNFGILETISDGFVSLDRDWRYVYIKDAH
jgi:hypothetical protein